MLVRTKDNRSYKLLIVTEYNRIIKIGIFTKRRSHYTHQLRSPFVIQPQAVVSKLRQENQPKLIYKAVHLGRIE
ncbi:hypothetical protein [uncultured Nostoc sp.]|uniref:hypothetical protein n=1 Tax=uncultured Nostoc sp. TaxID=340711 RepID=UPI0035CB4EC6